MRQKQLYQERAGVSEAVDWWKQRVTSDAEDDWDCAWATGENRFQER